ncbi:MAG: DUF6518 family protein [Thermoleophilaceae bacterium]|jgi:Family of unknown function (DUF6518)
MLTPMRRGLVVAFAAGLLLGLATRLVYELPREWWWLAKIGGPWLAVAFTVGLTVRRPLDGALIGAVCLVTAILIYYAIMGLLQHAYDASPLGLAWLFIAVPAGLAFGALGATVRRPGLRVPASAMLSAAFVAEALLTADRSRAGTAALLAGGLVVPLVTGRSYREQALTFGWTAALGGVAVAAGGVVFGLTGYS